MSAETTGQTADPAVGLTDALERLTSDRHSCRAYLPDQVPHDSIVRMLELAQKAASWCNSQPWQVVVTEGEATEKFRDALYSHATSLDWSDRKNRPDVPDYPFPRQYVGVYKERQRETGWALYRSVGIAYGDRAASGVQTMENFRLFGAPHVLIVTSEEDLGVYGAIDCGAYISNVLLAAQSLGVASVAQAALAGASDFIRDWFSIPPHRRIICAISFGFEDVDHPANAFRTTRAGLEDVATFVR